MVGLGWLVGVDKEGIKAKQNKQNSHRFSCQSSDDGFVTLRNTRKTRYITRKDFRNVNLRN